MPYKIIKTYFHEAKLLIMKQIITCAALVMFTFSGITVHAQSANAVSANDAILQKGEMVSYRDGKVVILRDNGTMVELRGNVVTGDGKLIKPDGTIVTNGKVDKIEDGKAIKADGSVVDLPVIKRINHKK
jgi:hypothetical protein